LVERAGIAFMSGVVGNPAPAGQLRSSALCGACCLITTQMQQFVVESDNTVGRPSSSSSLEEAEEIRDHFLRALSAPLLPAVTRWGMLAV